MSDSFALANVFTLGLAFKAFKPLLSESSLLLFYSYHYPHISYPLFHILFITEGDPSA